MWWLMIFHLDAVVRSTKRKRSKCENILRQQGRLWRVGIQRHFSSWVLRRELGEARDMIVLNLQLQNIFWLEAFWCLMWTRLQTWLEVDLERFCRRTIEQTVKRRQHMVFYSFLHLSRLYDCNQPLELFWKGMEMAYNSPYIEPPYIDGGWYNLNFIRFVFHS